jgi:hypothetical protein
MTDIQERLSRYRLPLRRDQLKQAKQYADPAVRFASRNPMLLIGAGLLAIAGIVAFTNRKKIAAKASPMIEDAKIKGQALMEEAAAKSHELLDAAQAKGQELLESAKAQGQAIGEKVRPRRNNLGNDYGPTDVH